MQRTYEQDGERGHAGGFVTGEKLEANSTKRWGLPMLLCAHICMPRNEMLSNDPIIIQPSLPGTFVGEDAKNGN